MPQQNQQHIHCIVSNCHYWSNGNKCSANEILVTSDNFGSQQPDKVDATMAQQLTPTTSSDCMETCCKTFVAKGSENTSVDGVQKIY